MTAQTIPDAATNLGEDLRQGLRRLAKGVVVITSIHEGQRYAMAATAVNEVSMDPPSLLICVNRNASLFAPLEARAPFAINILSAGHEDVCTICAGKAKGEARFDVGRWGAFANGCPVLEDAQASFLCSFAQAMDFGTHRVAIGLVEEVRLKGELAPLIYADGGFRALGSELTC